MFRAAMFTAALISLSAPLSAQETALDGCEVDPADYQELVAPLIAGTWIVQNGPGLVVGPGGFAMPMPPAADDVMTFTLGEDGTLSVLPVAGLSNLEVEWLDQSDNDGDHFGVPVPGINNPAFERRMDFDAIGRPVDCDSALLPLIQVSGEMIDPEGIIATFQTPLHFVDDTVMSGVFIMNVAGLHGRRLMTLTR